MRALCGSESENSSPFVEREKDGSRAPLGIQVSLCELHQKMPTSRMIWTDRFIGRQNLVLAIQHILLVGTDQKAGSTGDRLPSIARLHSSMVTCSSINEPRVSDQCSHEVQGADFFVNKSDYLVRQHRQRWVIV